LRARGLDHGVGILQRQQRQPIGLGAKAARMNLKIAAIQPHRVPEDRLVGSFDQAIKNEQ